MEHRTDQLRGHINTEDQKDFYADGVRGDLFHRQRSGAEVFYIHRYQVVKFLVILNSPRCNLGLFQSRVSSVWVCLNRGSSFPVDFKFGSEAVDEGDWGGQQRRVQMKTCIGGEPQQDQLIDGRGSRKDLCLQRISSRINHIDGRGSRKDLRLQRISSRIDQIDGRRWRKDLCLQRAEDQQQDEPHRRKMIKEWTIIGRGSRRASTSSGGERDVVHFSTKTNRTSSTSWSRSYIFSLLNV